MNLNDAARIAYSGLSGRADDDRRESADMAEEMQTDTRDWLANNESEDVRLVQNLGRFSAACRAMLDDIRAGYSAGTYLTGEANRFVVGVQDYGRLSVLTDAEAFRYDRLSIPDGVGFWTGPDGTIQADIITTCHDESDALAFAKVYGQVAYFDLAEGLGVAV